MSADLLSYGHRFNLGGARNPTPISSVTGTTYTLQLSDAGGIVQTGGAGGICTITVPPNSSVAFKPGDEVFLVRTTKLIAVSAGAGVTVTTSTGTNVSIVGGMTWLIYMGSDLWYAYSSQGAVADPVIYQSGSAITVSNTASKTAVATIPIPAGALGIDSVVQIGLIGRYLNNSASTKTITLEIVYGSTVMYACVSGAFTAAATYHPVSLQLILGANHSTAVQSMGGQVVMGVNGTATTGLGDLSTAVTAARGFNTAIFGASAEDSTTALNFVINVTHSAAATTITWETDYVYASLLT